MKFRRPFKKSFKRTGKKFYRKRYSKYMPKRMPQANSLNGAMYCQRRLQKVGIRNTTTNGQVAVYTANAGTFPTNHPLSINNTYNQQAGGGVNYDVPFSLMFQLDQVEGLSDFTNLFDHYRITHAWVRAKYTGSRTGTTLDTIIYMQTPPTLSWVVDLDDSVVQPITNFNQRMGIHSRVVKTDSLVKMSCKPRNSTAGLASTGTLITGLSSKFRRLDIGVPDVPHYGIKGLLYDFPALDNTTTGVYAAVEFDIVLGIKFYGLR